MIVAQEVAWKIGLIPFAFVASRSVAHAVDRAYWIIALAFGVSFIADTVSMHEPSLAWLISLVYPVSQAALIAAVLLPRRDTITFVCALVVSGLVSVALRGTQGPDVLLRTVAWLGLAFLVMDRWALGRLRTALVVYFGVGWMAWLLRAIYLTVPWWYVTQSVRLAGILLFCWAVMQPGPRLRVAT